MSITVAARWLSSLICKGNIHTAVKDYNVGMQGVDIGDEIASYHPTTWRYKVWYRKVFFLFDMVIVNA